MIRIRSAWPIASLLFALACSSSPAMMGESCVDTADCEVGLSCFEHEGAETSPVCMPDCDLATTRLCAGGEVCTPPDPSGPARDPNLGVCYLGGTTEVGGDCTSDPDRPGVASLTCVRGAICVEVSDAFNCYRACDTADGSACDASETCTALEAMGTNGFCLPTP